MPRYKRILKKRGPLRTYSIYIVASMLNGCLYCTFGHAHAFQLHYLNVSDRLFPLSDDALLALISLPKDQAVRKYCSALNDADLQDDVLIVHRAVELINKAQTTGKLNASDPLDNDIEHLIGMFSALNACGITDDVEPDEAHDPINKDKVLIGRYNRLRAHRSIQQITC